MSGPPPNVRQLIATATEHFSRGRLDQAEAACGAALKLFPGSADAQHVLGLVLLQRGRLAEAETALTKAARLAPKAAPIHSNRGLALLRMGKPQDALKAFDRTVALAPGAPEAHANRGLALAALGRHSDALTSFDRALTLRPDFADARQGRAVAIANQQGPEVGLDAIDQVIARYPGHIDALKSRGDLLRQLGRCQEARAAYEQVLTLAPARDDVSGNLAGLLLEMDLAAEAEPLFRRVLDRGVRSQALSLAAAACALALGDAETALRRADEALEAGADRASAFDVKGRALAQLGRNTEALAALDAGIELSQDDPERQIQKGMVLRRMARRDEALAAFAAAQSLIPEDQTARWLAALTQLPAVSRSVNEAQAAREAFARALDEFESDTGDDAPPASAVGRLQPFFLAYQDQNNRMLLQRYGAIVAKAMSPHQPGPSSERPLGDKLRVGIVSSKFQSHSVFTALLQGWIEHLDPRHISLITFDTGQTSDAMTAWTRDRTDHVRLRGGLEASITAVHEKAPDVLIYPEIGMDARSLQLAALRLAPYQLASWGHPETTGLPTIDAYLSAVGLEPADADAAYTETLVRLPGLGCSYPRSSVGLRAVDLSALGLARDGALFICPGVPFKYQPQHDRVLVDIARALGRCTFAFFAPTNDTIDMFERTQERIADAFSQAGLDAKTYIARIPWLRTTEFHGLLAQATAMLDTIGFSGFNTAMQALERDLPVVTIEGRFLRGRLASGILREMGLGDVVCADPDAYVALAVRLANDQPFRNALRARITARRDPLFDDRTSVDALQIHLLNRFGRG